LDANELTWVSISFVIIVALGLFIGKFMDVFFRAKLFRMIWKTKDFGILGMVSPDSKSIRMIVVDFSKDVVQHKGKVWIVLKDRIYRHDKPERGLSLDKTDLPIRWIEGIPVLYVNENTYSPIDMTGQPSEVRPEEVNSVFSSWINNQLAKAMAKILGTFKQQQQLLIIIAVMALLAAGIGYITMQNTNNMQAGLDGANAKIQLICVKTGACEAPPAPKPPTPTPGGK
jgi:hypothetical protein